MRIPDREECQDLADYNEGREPTREHHNVRTYDELLRAYPNVEVRDGKATLSYTGRKQLKSRRAGTRPVRYPLAQLRMIEAAIGCTIAADAAVDEWRRHAA